MTRSEAVERLKALEPELRKLGVRSIALFGSVLYAEALRVA
ncbi:MAG TPA: hypothetical protein VKT78_15555 [Fimbriimonadaceae bacterium]|nr:hypothetical protein [Fimbriimonadaceae bacterium]